MGPSIQTKGPTQLNTGPFFKWSRDSWSTEHLVLLPLNITGHSSIKYSGPLQLNLVALFKIEHRGQNQKNKGPSMGALFNGTLSPSSTLGPLHLNIEAMFIWHWAIFKWTLGPLRLIIPSHTASSLNIVSFKTVNWPPCLSKPAPESCYNF